MDLDSNFPLGAHRLTEIDRLSLGVTVSGLLGLLTLLTHADLRWMLFAGTWACAYATWKRDWQLFKLLIMVFPAYLIGFNLSRWAMTFQHRRIDDTLAALDHGVYLLVWNWCKAHQWTNLILIPVYYAMGAAIVGCLVFTKRRGELLWALFLAGLAGTIIYWIFPAVGPVALPQSATAYPNGFPSLHLTIALVCWWYADGHKWVFGIFAVLTFFATLGLGEHYLVDLIVALPFTALMCAAAQFGATLPFRARRLRLQYSSRPRLAA